jgi:hypothetical protein
MKINDFINNNGVLMDISIEAPSKLNIKTKTINYFGYKQGYKVYLNGIKYPKKHGNFYAFMNKKQAIIHCLINDYSYQ